MCRLCLIHAVVCLALAVSGCASSPWSAKNVASPPIAPADPQQLQNVQADLQRLGPVDPVAQGQLLADLQQSDPAIWPLVIAQFRASQAYRLQAMRRSDASGYVQRLPPADGQQPVPTEPQQTPYPDTSAAPSGVLPASYTPWPTNPWRQRLNDAIEALEAETPASPATPADLAQHARLRLLYAAAGRRTDAAQPIPSASPATQQFFSKEVEGLGAWLDVEQAPDPIRRAAEAKPALVEATAKLGETGPLLVHNAAFCSEVLSFGCIKRFDKFEFAPNQELLLYAEVENFVSESSDQGFHTSLRAAYQVLDELGRQVVRRDFSAADDHCKSRRRDYFVVYRFRLPRRIDPGKYMLRLVVQDALSQKTGQASIEFTVKSGKPEESKPKPNVT
jgi:hypothetical protein